MNSIVFPFKSRVNRESKDHLVIQVRCPHCKGTHSHGIKKTAGLPESRIADCGKGSYLIAVRSES